MADAGKPKVTRNKKVTIGPPGELSFSSLLKGDTKFGESTFYVQVGYDEAGLERLSEILGKDQEDLYKKFQEEHSYKGKPPAAVQTWLEDKVQTPADPKYTPTVKFAVKEEGKGRDGSTFNRTMTIWDVKNNILDLAKLKMGRGSIIQPVFKTGLYLTALIKVPTLTLQLQGVRVLKLVQFGGKQALDAVDPTDVEGLDMDMDLGAFAQSNHPAKDDDDLEEAASPF